MFLDTLQYGCESWKMTEKVKRKLNGAASKMLATITSRTIQEEARLTINVEMRLGTEDGAGWDKSYACQTPAGAPSPVKLRQTYSRDAFRRRT